MSKGSLLLGALICVLCKNAVAGWVCDGARPGSVGAEIDPVFVATGDFEWTGSATAGGALDMSTNNISDVSGIGFAPSSYDALPIDLAAGGSYYANGTYNTYPAYISADGEWHLWQQDATHWHITPEQGSLDAAYFYTEVAGQIDGYYTGTDYSETDEYITMAAGSAATKFDAYTLKALYGLAVSGEVDPLLRFNQYQHQNIQIPVDSDFVWSPGMPSGCFGYTGTDADIRVPYQHAGVGIGFTRVFSFEDNQVIETVEFPRSVHTIQDYTFKNAINLTSVVLNGPVTYLSALAFNGCSSLTSVTFVNCDQPVPNGLGPYYGLSANQVTNYVLNPVAEWDETYGGMPVVRVEVNADTVRLLDNKKIVLGSSVGGDAEVYHDGADLYIDPITGDLVVEGNTIVEGTLAVKTNATVYGSVNYGEDDTAFGDTYFVNLEDASMLAVTGMTVTFKADIANTGACQLGINTDSTYFIKAYHDQDPPDNYIEDGSIVVVVFDGTNWQLISPDANP
jgi:hypothetical protein